MKDFLKNPHRRVELLIGGVLILWMLIAQAGAWMDPVESMLLDLRFRMRGEKRMPGGVVMIGIDEASLDHPRSGPWPWSRNQFARLLETLNREGLKPRAIGFDKFFENKDPKDETGDASFQFRAEEAGRNLILGYYFEKGFRSRFERDDAKEVLLHAMALKVEGSAPPALEVYDKVSLPYRELGRSALLGFSNLPRDRDGATRRLKLLASYRGRVYPSLELLLAAASSGVEPSEIRVRRDRIVFLKNEKKVREIPVTPEGDMWMQYFGSERLRKSYYSFMKVIDFETMLTPEQTQEMKKAIQGNLVLMGQSALSLKDTYTTPFDPAQPGLLVRAQGLKNLLEGNWLHRAPVWISAVMVLVLGLGVMAVTMFLPVTRALPLAAALGAGYFTLTYFAFLNRLWIDAAVPLITLVLVFLSILSYRYFTALEELKRMQSELIHSEKLAMVGQISSGMAHEFRNILHAIKLHVEGCARPGVPVERVQRYMGVIFKTMENAELILNGILTFSRKNQSDKKPGSLKKNIEDTLLLLQKELQYQNIQVQTHLEEVSTLDFDAGQMSQVLMNLLNNARDALHDRPEKVVIIRLREEKGDVLLDVADNGPGIPPQVMKNLFKPFVTSKEAGKGTGLGLSMCQRIVQNHGGDITVHSIPEQGTIWHIRLPKPLH